MSEVRKTFSEAETGQESPLRQVAFDAVAIRLALLVLRPSGWPSDKAGEDLAQQAVAVERGLGIDADKRAKARG